VSANSAVRMLGVVRTAINYAIVEHSLNIPNVFTNLRIKGAGASKLDRLPRCCQTNDCKHQIDGGNQNLCA